jgi:hypothetical protein
MSKNHSYGNAKISTRNPWIKALYNSITIPLNRSLKAGMSGLYIV